jgi:hypothetical protein
MTTNTEIAAYLSNLPCVRNVTACTVTIGPNVYPAAHYWQDLTTPEGSQAYQRGERTYTREMIFIVGMLPSVYLRSSRQAFTRTDDTREWYIASYAGLKKNGKQAAQEINEFHPFGNSFLLAPWDCAEAIDHYESTPYRRQAMTLVR